jgi:adenosylcobyric acid synthase
MSDLAPVLMVQGTASSVGKSTLVAGLCRLFVRRGVRVAPFKAQNMSNNAAVCEDGGEIGRAQFAQALAAGIAATVDMNPILLKPQPGGSQIVVRGQVLGRRATSDYFGSSGRRELWPVVTDALDRLRAEYELVIAEGAGSPAEVNLRSGDIVNMAVALYATADVLLVADIDRGGAFAALLGTWDWLSPDERKLVRGFVLNKFRGDPGLLAPAPMLLEQRTGVPVVGVVPYVQDLLVPEEDAASLVEQPGRQAVLEIALVRLPHLANFDEFGALAHEPGVHLRWVAHISELRAPDLVILPGSKATIPDLLWLRERRLAERIQWLARHGTPILGTCGGFQMLGRSVSDPSGIESGYAAERGLELLPIETILGETKSLRRVQGRCHAGLTGVWSACSGLPVNGYEIHVGQSTTTTTTTTSASTPLLDLGERNDGAISPDGVVAGTYVHGLLEQPTLRHALLRELARARGFDWGPTACPAADPFDRLADVLSANLRVDYPRLRDSRIR